MNTIDYDAKRIKSIALTSCEKKYKTVRRLKNIHLRLFYDLNYPKNSNFIVSICFQQNLPPSVTLADFYPSPGFLFI